MGKLAHSHQPTMDMLAARRLCAEQGGHVMEYADGFRVITADPEPRGPEAPALPLLVAGPFKTRERAQSELSAIYRELDAA